MNIETIRKALELEKATGITLRDTGETSVFFPDGDSRRFPSVEAALEYLKAPKPKREYLDLLSKLNRAVARVEKHIAELQAQKIELERNWRKQQKGLAA